MLIEYGLDGWEFEVLAHRCREMNLEFGRDWWKGAVALTNEEGRLEVLDIGLELPLFYAPTIPQSLTLANVSHKMAQYWDDMIIPENVCILASMKKKAGIRW